MRLKCILNMTCLPGPPPPPRHLGDVGDGLELDPIDVDFGHLDFDIAQVDVVLTSPFKPWARSSSSCSSTGRGPQQSSKSGGAGPKAGGGA